MDELRPVGGDMDPMDRRFVTAARGRQSYLR